MTTAFDTARRNLGQLFMVGLAGCEVDDSTRELIGRCGINHFILFKRNVQTPEQLGGLCRGLARACDAAGLGAPLISIDQEGGTVTRLPPPFTQFPDARVLAEGTEPEAALRGYAETCARELREVGINMNLAPVLDLCPAGEGCFMERRVLGSDPATVARLGCLVIETMQQSGVAACAKHFPGLGAAVLDPHQVLPTVTRSAAELRRLDLPPFAAACKSGVAAVMTSHTIYSGLDPATPATLSPRILQGVLRTELGYDGLVITDDLEMGAIENARSVAAASLAAFVAGADMLLICHDHRKVRTAYDALLAALHDGLVAGDRVCRSLSRIAAVQRRFAGQ
ncbi:MAG: beta-N-acetylhexosaminidase [Thermodesulfobacteriota bacterium]